MLHTSAWCNTILHQGSKLIAQHWWSSHPSTTSRWVVMKEFTCTTPGPCAAIREEAFVACHLLSWLKEASASILPSKAAAPSLHTSLHVCGMEGPTSGSSLRVPKLGLASVLELCGGSCSAQLRAVGSLCCVAITLFAVCSAWEHMALSGWFVCFRVFLFLSILVYCHK